MPSCPALKEPIETAAPERLAWRTPFFSGGPCVSFTVAKNNVSAQTAQSFYGFFRIFGRTEGRQAYIALA